MPNFSFRGFTTGSSVALSVAQGALTASGSINSWGEGTAHVGSLNILTTASAALVAPAGIWLEATDIAGFDVPGGPGPGETYDPSFHDITFIWTVNGAPLAPYQAPENMVNSWNDPNTAYGKKVAFHFPDPGTYTITLWAVDRSGNTGQASTTIAVANADSLYPGAQTVCFSNAPGESWADEKPGCQRVTSFAALQTAVNNAGGPLRILFKRGQSILRPDATRIRMTSNGQWLNHIGAWGSGDKPILHCLKNWQLFEYKNNHPVTHFTCEMIDFRGDWDAASETGVPDRSPFIFLQGTTDCHFTISHCSFDGLDAVWFGTGDTNSTMVVADCVATNWRDYGSFIHGSPNQKFAMIGSRFQQNVDALNGSPPPWAKNGFYNDHGPLRFSSLGDCYLACSDFFSRNGWSPLGPDKADQACIRVNSGGGADPATCIIERCVCEGGYQVVTMEGADSSRVEHPGNYLIDRALLIASGKTFKSFVTVEYGGTTIRNCVGVMPDTPAAQSNGWKGAIKLEAQSPAPGNLDSPIRVYGNTFVNLRDTDSDPGDPWPVITQTAAFTDVTFENNIVHAPNIDTPVSGGPISLSADIPGVTRRYKGVLYNEFGQEDGTLGTAVADGADFTVDYPLGTDQSYWQAIESIDTRHKLTAGGSIHHAQLGDFSVTFQSNNIRVTNASGNDWNAGSSFSLKLDRTSQMSAIPSTYESLGPVPLPRPTSSVGSGLGLIPHDDFEGQERGPNSAGALEV